MRAEVLPTKSTLKRAWELSGEIGEDGRKAYPASRKEMEMKLSHLVFACLNGLG